MATSCINHPDKDVFCKGVCRPCYNKEYNKINADHITKYRKEYWNRPGKRENNKQHHIKRSYGLTKEEYDFVKGDGTCNICGNISYKMCVDHSHKTGKIRGYLCFNCNTMLGHAIDDIERLKSAIKYLEETKCQLLA